MSKFIYKKLNAFSVSKSEGNPAACLYLNQDQQLSESEMLMIAKEHKGFVSEVIFCNHLTKHSYRLRYYSSECEVEFCGHGTIACMYDLIKNNDELNILPEISILTNKGELKVYNEISSLNAIFISAPEPIYLNFPVDINEISEYLNIPRTIFDNEYPIEVIDAGLKTLIIPLNQLTDLITTTPDEANLKKFTIDKNIDIILIFSQEVVNKRNKVRTRVFAPKFGYLEDPATGSGNSALGYYLLKHYLWKGEPISIEQNGERYTYNVVKLKTINQKVLFGGNAIVRIEGNFIL
ncbi:MAG: PhzF family phenazine biosynthesis isomerase [Bacteroides sp.]|nr:PhzF family phenazine biosynthesis isomerase [Bacteroides sp.]